MNQDHLRMNEDLRAGVFDEQVLDHGENNGDSGGRCGKRQPGETLDEGADEISGQMSGGEEEVDQEEEPRTVLGTEYRSVSQ